MKSLKELCQENIATSICNVPPMLQEMVIGETKEKMREQIRKELMDEIRAEENARKDMLDMIQYLVPAIMKDIVFSITHNNESREDFYKLWPNVSRDTIKAAIMIAESSINEMEDRYIHREFSLSESTIYMETDSSFDEDEEQEWDDY